MNVLDPQSTTFQRSEARRIVGEQGRIAWSQDWVAETTFPTTCAAP